MSSLSWKAIFATVVVGFLCGPALADWEYTKWGMTREQVATASSGRLGTCDTRCRIYSGSTEVAGLVGSYRKGEFEFTAFAMFSPASDALVSITLVWQDGRSDALLKAMFAQYGDPAEFSATNEISTAVWFGKEYDIIMRGFGLLSYYAPNIIQPSPRRRQ